MINEELFKSYGCLKVDYRSNEDGRYYLFGFKNKLPEWDFNKGELILITRDKHLIQNIKKKILTIHAGDLFCRECFRKKSIEKLSSSTDIKYWCKHFWSKTPKEAKEKLQNKILYLMPDMDWSLVKFITTRNNSPLVFHGICSTHCMNRDAYQNNIELQIKEEKLTQLWKEIITDELLKGNEELLENYLVDHIELIEEGMQFVDRQVKVEHGVIDILATDKNDTQCIIELKTTDPGKNIVWQTAYYPSCFEKSTRIITIAPTYSPKIYDALKNVNNVEIKFFLKNTQGLFEIKEFLAKNTVNLSKEVKIIDIPETKNIV
ncbi:endonuclease NucS domain-containing protein [Bacillus pretiosus]|uniref:endonuclease NucS domain-containing protein n=1 Tax=Bacillus pretiosus TaxID=2983392 RepID=UPI003D64ACF8